MGQHIRTAQKPDFIQSQVKLDKELNTVVWPNGADLAPNLLERFKTEKINHKIICNCLINLKDKEEGIKYAAYFLEKKDWRKENWSIVYHSLYCFCHVAKLPKFVVEIVDTIIKEYPDKKIKE